MAQGLTDSERDALMTQPTVFAPGEDKLSEQALRAVSPQEMLWRHGSVAGLSQALIMMVDDEMLNIEMTQAFLVEAGYGHFVQTDRPEQAVAMMRKHMPGVLLLDLSMPKVSGLDILAKYTLWSVGTGRPEALDDALALRMAAIEAAEIVFRVCHQLHGAVGFCDETTLSWLSRYSQPLRRLPLGLSATRDTLTRRLGRTGLVGLFSGADELDPAAAL